MLSLLGRVARPHVPTAGAVPLAVLVALATSAGCGLLPASPGAGGDGAGDAHGGATPATLLVGPADGADSILAAVRGARRRVRLAMYLLTAPSAIAALADARAAGRDVEVLLERSPYDAAGANDAAFAALAAAGVDVRWVAAARGLLHAKLLIVDDATAYVMTLNWTASGLGMNREYTIVDGDAADVDRAGRVWLAAAVGADEALPAGGGRLLASPTDARARLTAAIDGARASITIQMEELSDPQLIARLAAAHDRGVAIVIVAPAADRSAATDAALRRLADGGAAVRALPFPTVHAKAMVIDGRRVYVGSVNFTRASLDDNREVGFLADAPDLAGRLRETITADATRGSPL